MSAQEHSRLSGLQRVWHKLLFNNKAARKTGATLTRISYDHSDNPIPMHRKHPLHGIRHLLSKPEAPVSRSFWKLYATGLSGANNAMTVNVHITLNDRDINSVLLIFHVVFRRLFWIITPQIINGIIVPIRSPQVLCRVRYQKSKPNLSTFLQKILPPISEIEPNQISIIYYIQHTWIIDEHMERTREYL